MKICVAGQGAFGIKHLEAIANIDGVEVVSLAGGNPAGTEEVAKRFGIPHWTTDLAESLAQPGVDPNRIAALGYGAGGQVVLELARIGVAFRAIAVVHPAFPDAEDRAAVVGARRDGDGHQQNAEENSGAHTWRFCCDSLPDASPVSGFPLSFPSFPPSRSQS